MTPDLIDDTLQYLINISSFIFQSEQFEAAVALFSFSYPWNALIEHELWLTEVLHLGLPVDSEFLIHLIEEKLLLAALPAELVLHLQSRLLHYRVKELQLCSVSLLMILLKLLDALNFVLSFEVVISLRDLLLHLLSNVEEPLVPLLYSLLSHEQVVLDLLH